MTPPRPIGTITSPWSGRPNVEVNSLHDYVRILDRLTAPAQRATRNDWQFIFRGQADADWGLTSLLTRELANEMPLQDVTDHKVAARERAIIDEAKRWRLDYQSSGRVNVELLAALQHHGTPTRLIDFTHNALIALWFAVADEASEGQSGVVLVLGGDLSIEIDPAPRVTNADVARGENRRLPWAAADSSAWQAEEPLLLYSPPPVDQRITRQSGCFLIGRVPADRTKRALTSVDIPLAMTQAHLDRMLAENPGSGRWPQGMFMFTFMVAAERKVTLRQQLQRTMGYEPAAMFSDLAGFSRFRRRG